MKKPGGYTKEQWEKIISFKWDIESIKQSEVKGPIYNGFRRVGRPNTREPKVETFVILPRRRNGFDSNVQEEMPQV